MIEERVENLDVVLPNDKTVVVYGRTGKNYHMGEYDIKTGRVVNENEVSFNGDHKNYAMLMAVYSSVVTVAAAASWMDSAIRSLKETL